MPNASALTSRRATTGSSEAASGSCRRCTEILATVDGSHSSRCPEPKRNGASTTSPRRSGDRKSRSPPMAAEPDRIPAFDEHRLHADVLAKLEAMRAGIVNSRDVEQYKDALFANDAALIAAAKREAALAAELRAADVELEQTKKRHQAIYAAVYAERTLENWNALTASKAALATLRAELTEAVRLLELV